MYFFDSFLSLYYTELIIPLIELFFAFCVFLIIASIFKVIN